MLILWKSEAVTYAQLDDIAITVWHHPITLPDMQAVTKIARERLPSFAPHSVGLLMVMEEAALGNFDAESRRLNIELFGLIKPALRVGAGVVEGRGMRSGAFRLAATAVNLATGLDIKVFSHLEPACAHVAEGLPGADYRALLRHVELIRRGPGAHRAHG